jgi:hypothetical protein
MLRFAVASIVAALVLVWADSPGGAWLFTWTSVPWTHFVYRAVAWACMFGGVMLVTPAPRDWANAAVCGLLLSVAFIFAREITLFGSAALSVHDLYAHWLAALSLFALLVWPIGIWYRRLARA